jgi:hypothetical protein
MSLATAVTFESAPRSSTRRLWAARARNAPATILELVWLVSELTPNDDEVVATVSHMIRSGAVRLRTQASRD